MSPAKNNNEGYAYELKGKAGRIDPHGSHHADYQGPTNRRSCTDVICLALIIVFVACWIGIGLYAFIEGDPDLILVPKDSSGLRCGIDAEVKKKPYLFFFDLTKCLGPSVPFIGCNTPQVCVEHCPDYYYVFDKTGTDVAKLICKPGITPNIANAKALINSNDCASWYLPSESFQKRCVPLFNMTSLKYLAKDLGKDVDTIISSVNRGKTIAQVEQVGENMVEDLTLGWWKIVVGVLIGLVVSLIFIVLTRFIGGFMVWLSLLGVVAALAFGVGWSAKKYHEISHYNETTIENINSSHTIAPYNVRKNFWLALAIIAAIVLLIVLLMIIFLRKRILMAIALVKEGSKAVSSVTSSFIFPIFPCVLQVGVIAYCVAVALFLSTTGQSIYKVRNVTDTCFLHEGDICNPSNFSEITRNDPNCATAICKHIGMSHRNFYPALHVINVFGGLWLAFFASALGEMILALVFARWYWTKPKSDLPFFALTTSTLTVLRYHIGTLAFGSLIIAICRMIRIMLEYIDRQLKKYDNGFVKGILCCMKCFFWCLEKFLKFINTNAYIMCAMRGKNFCVSAKDAFSLLMRNVLRVFVLDKVTDFMFFLSKVLITVGIGALSYLLFVSDITAIDNSNQHYPEIIVVVIVIITYLITSILFSVFSMAVDTLFLCFLQDIEKNDGSSEKPYYMSKSLMKIFGKKNKQS